jgi:hypothetical protein
MAVRIRKDGRILCAAMHHQEPGDVYLHDGIHGHLARACILVTEPMDGPAGRGGHAVHGEWWWRTDVPADVVPESREPVLQAFEIKRAPTPLVSN